MATLFTGWGGRGGGYMNRDREHWQGKITLFKLVLVIFKP